MKRINIFLLFLIVFLSACHPLKRIDTEDSVNRSLYNESIKNARAPSSSKIYNGLISITKKNKDLVWKEINGEDYVLVVSWKQNISYYEPYLDSTYYHTSEYPIWVTTAPELLQKMKQEKVGNLNLRIKQLLGLPPNSNYNYFVEFWVRPNDLFRPCPDSEITDKQCDLCFPNDTDSSYISWVNDNRIKRYYQCDLFNKYPWTQLGYTYDWSPKNKSYIGLSEFVIAENKDIIVEAIYSTNEYLKKGVILYNDPLKGNNPKRY